MRTKYYYFDRQSEFFTILDDVRKARGTQDPFDKELGEVAILYKMLLVEFPIILERWKRTIELDG